MQTKRANRTKEDAKSKGLNASAVTDVTRNTGTTAKANATKR